jgi:riboflavin transporter FmnP
MPLTSCVLDVSNWKWNLKYKYWGRTPKFFGKCHFYKIKKKWGGPIFEGWAGMIIYQLSWIGLIYMYIVPLAQRILSAKIGSVYKVVSLWFLIRVHIFRNVLKLICTLVFALKHVCTKMFSFYCTCNEIQC